MPVTPNTLLYLPYGCLCVYSPLIGTQPTQYSSYYCCNAEWYWIKWYFMHWQIPISNWDWKLFLLICRNL